MTETRRSPNDPLGPILGWWLFAALHISCLFLWLSALRGHIPKLYWLEQDSRLFWVSLAIMPFGYLFMLQPDVGLTKFGRNSLSLSVSWWAIYTLFCYHRDKFSSDFAYTFLLVTPILVQGISVWILVKSRRKA